MKPTDFAIRLANFLGEYLPAQKNDSPNTIKAYRDAFKLLLRYCRDSLEVYPEKLTLDTLNAPLVLRISQLSGKRGKLQCADSKSPIVGSTCIF